MEIEDQSDFQSDNVIPGIDGNVLIDKKGEVEGFENQKSGDILNIKEDNNKNNKRKIQQTGEENISGFGVEDVEDKKEEKEMGYIKEKEKKNDCLQDTLVEDKMDKEHDDDITNYELLVDEDIKKQKDEIRKQLIEIFNKNTFYTFKCFRVSVNNRIKEIGKRLNIPSRQLKFIKENFKFKYKKFKREINSYDNAPN